MADWNELRWALRYLLARRSDNWYQSLFPDIPGKTTGEICPGYAKLRGQAVGRVHLLMPNAKVIYLLRNPIERSWSYAAQYFTSPRWKDRYGSLDRVSERDLKEFLERDRFGHSDYLGALNAWQTYYGEGQMLIAFFDELARDPKCLLKRILDFLGIESSESVIPATVGKNRNPSRGAAASPELRTFLARLHMDQLAELHARFGNAWTSAWLISARQAIANDPSRISKSILQRLNKLALFPCARSFSTSRAVP